mmetsp:Transcript_6543/g.8622  ORF Transcript_6543/g.8622 Transcript_6543/m.8622 type:complete len:123 (-) Transcript_6543:225-593(-)
MNHYCNQGWNFWKSMITLCCAEMLNSYIKYCSQHTFCSLIFLEWDLVVSVLVGKQSRGKGDRRQTSNYKPKKRFFGRKQIFRGNLCFRAVAQIFFLCLQNGFLKDKVVVELRRMVSSFDLQR